MGAKKKTTEKKRRGSAAGVKPQAKGPARAHHNGKQEELTAKGKPLTPSDDILEECDRLLVAANEQVKAEQENRKAVIARALTRLSKLGLPKYKTRSGFVFEARTKDVLTRKRAPKDAGKPKRARKGQPVPQAVA